MKKFFAMFCLYASTTLLNAQITIRTYQGKEARAHLRTISDLCVTVFKKYPYFNATPVEYHMFYTEQYASNQETRVCIIYDDTKAIGVATGIPLADFYVQPLIKHREEIKSIYYLGELILLAEYRMQGYGKMLYEEFEKQIKALNKYQSICFCEIDRSTVPFEAPADFKSLNDFWTKLGFKKWENVDCYMGWPDSNTHQEIPHRMVFWIKSILGDLSI